MPDRCSLSLSSRVCGGHAGEVAELVMEFVFSDVLLPLQRLPRLFLHKASRIFFGWKSLFETPIQGNNKKKEEAETT